MKPVVVLNMVSSRATGAAAEELGFLAEAGRFLTAGLGRQGAGTLR